MVLLIRFRSFNMKTLRKVLLLLAFITLSSSIKIKQFPEDFLFGSATSAYQTEGAWNVSGKGENVWDRFIHSNPDRIRDKSNGDIACDSYHKVEEDVALLKELGVNYYRFSLSWSRILPRGLAYKVNSDGIRHYNKLINLLIQNGIAPLVTIFHWDTPQELQDLGGFTNELMVKWFRDYAEVVFENFGDRVKKWLTINEPSLLCVLGYGAARSAPGSNSSGIGDYLCMHNILKAHAEVYHLYDKQFRPIQNGSIGITLDATFAFPKSQRKEDTDAAERMLQFQLAWCGDPIYHPKGDYPEVMKKFVGERSKKEGFAQSRLPTFTQEEINKIKGTSDFFGLNHYTSTVAKDISDHPYDVPSIFKDYRIAVESDPSWPASPSSWIKVVPEGFRRLLKWIKKRYGDIEILVTENGFLDHGGLDDQGRINYFKLYLSTLLEAIHEDKVNVKAYTAWSLLDNFEWSSGYMNRFGLHHVDFNDPFRKRTPKASAYFLRYVFKNKKLD